MRWYSGSGEFCNTNLSLTALLAEAMHESSKRLTANLASQVRISQVLAF